MVNYYIFCHACYIPFNQSGYKNPNVNLWFDVDINKESCSTELNLNFDTSKYTHQENYMAPKNEYILSFNDAIYSSSKSALKMFGLFNEDENRVEIKDITNGMYKDILLSDLLRFLLRKNERANIYCAFCRKACDDPIIPKNEHLEFGKNTDNNNEDDSMEDFKVARFEQDDDIDFANLFGGKRKYRSRKKTTQKRARKNAKKYLYKKKTSRKRSRK